MGRLMHVEKKNTENWKVLRSILGLLQVVTAATPPPSPQRSVTPSPTPLRSASPAPPVASDVERPAGPPSPSPELAVFGAEEQDHHHNPNLATAEAHEAKPHAAAAGGPASGGSQSLEPGGAAALDSSAAAAVLAAALPEIWQAALANMQGAEAAPGHILGTGPAPGHTVQEGHATTGDAQGADAPEADTSNESADRGRRPDNNSAPAGTGGSGAAETSLGFLAGSKRPRSTAARRSEAPAAPGRKRGAGAARPVRSETSSKVRRTKAFRRRQRHRGYKY